MNNRNTCHDVEQAVRLTPAFHRRDQGSVPWDLHEIKIDNKKRGAQMWEFKEKSKDWVVKQRRYVKFRES